MTSCGARTCEHVVSFKDLFECVEANDEEAAARADKLQTLYSLFVEETFTSANLFAKFEESARRATIRGEAEDAGASAIRTHLPSMSVFTSISHSSARNLNALATSSGPQFSGLGHDYDRIRPRRELMEVIERPVVAGRHGPAPKLPAVIFPKGQGREGFCAVREIEAVDKEARGGARVPICRDH
jgi:hypothetical protein